MRIPLTKYGLPEVLVYPAVVVALMTVLGLIGVAFLPRWAVASIEITLAGVAVWVLSFFRDPQRHVQADDPDIIGTLLAPADGRITDVELVQQNEFIGASALRIGIFLSIFNTHINRSPCNARVEKVHFKPGKYRNAADPRSGQANESNDLDLVRTDSPKDRLVVRQISGAIARRIVCQAREGQELAAGEKFGMIKFGSRTELYVPIREDLKCLVKIGDKVKAGLTPLVKYQGRADGTIQERRF
jgi:phosphatidylserine decarboxylase